MSQFQYILRLRMKSGRFALVVFINIIRCLIIGLYHKKFSQSVLHAAHVRQEEHRLQSKFPQCPLYDLYRISDYLDSLPLIDIAIHSYHNNNNSDHLIRYGRGSDSSTVTTTTKRYGLKPIMILLSCFFYWYHHVVYR